MAPSSESPPGDPRQGFAELREPSPDFIARVLAIVSAIPPGRVMAYGDVAAAIGEHPDLVETTGSYGARLVGNVLSRFGHQGVPWWRVIRATGQPPRGYEARAWPHYLREGTPLVGDPEKYRIDIKQARYLGPEPMDEPAPRLF